MKIKQIGYVIMTVSILILTSCEDSSLCLSGQNAIQSGLYSGVTGEAKDTTLSGIYMWGVELATLTDMPLLIDSANVRSMYMPTDIERDSTMMVLREETIASDLQDTLLFIYTRELNYVNGECGFTYNLELDTVIFTDNIIDSIVISYPSVKYNETLENVKIFIEP